MKILLTRHGRTNWNDEHKVQGAADISLNETGLKQAEIVREKLKDTKIDYIISSPLSRAKQTAEIIRGDRNIPLFCDSRIAERDFGEYEGFKSSDFDFDKFWDYDTNATYELAENIKDFFDRIYQFLDEITEQYKDKTVLVVAHAGVSIPAQLYLFNEQRNSKSRTRLKNCEVLEINL